MNTHYSFIGGQKGQWLVTRCDAIVGAPVDTVKKLHVINSSASTPGDHGTWVLQGFTSNVRYAERHEINQLRAKFDKLLVKLRASEEWKYVEREVDIRMVKDYL